MVLVVVEVAVGALAAAAGEEEEQARLFFAELCFARPVATLHFNLRLANVDLPLLHSACRRNGVSRTRGSSSCVDAAARRVILKTEFVGSFDILS